MIGSCRATAKTTDFMKWQIEQRGGSANNYPAALKYYPQDKPGASTAPDSTAQTMERQKADVLRPEPNDGLNFFASDIHHMPNGKFYHYYSLTSTWKSSAIGVAVAENVDGPYVSQGLFVRSAEAGNNRTPDGTETWSFDSHPNCIDPQAFFDNDGKFWLVYGSWSGGIFIYEMDPDTGVKKEGAALNAENGGYGRKLIANRHSGIEAPYIIYSPEAQYYYLFTSFGGLAANGGYNIRIFRSRSAEGPYEDAEHKNGLGTQKLHPEEGSEYDFRSYGVKLMGGYQFAHIPGESGASKTTGYLSPGHNSAYRDPLTGKYYLIHHTRFVGGKNNIPEAHEVRVREMFVNEDGWLIAAPFRYDAGTERNFNASQLNGVWKLINHGRDINTTAHNSEAFEFSSEGIISGAGSGAWSLGGDGKTAYITLDGVLYKGVFLRSWDDDHKKWVQAFTALSANGIALWGAMKAQ
jgi:arabinan endo-1,5-alpha-L-arabinosidase